MESTRFYYEHPAAHANLPPRDYGGSVTPAKARRSWGDLLKFRSRNKDRHLTQVTDNLAPPSNMPAAPPSHNYMAEYRQKYGAYNGTVGRSSYQTMTVVKSISPVPTPPSANLQKGYPSHGYPTNGYTKHVTSGGTISAGTRATMASTVRYTDWFGSVVGRRPPARPPLPTFAAAPPVAIHTTEKSSAWDHYVTLDPVYEAPHVVPVQLYTNVCVCPNQMINTKGRKKKKCKRCGRKVASMRHATTGVAAKVRPVIPANMYQPPPPQLPPAAPQHAWGWQVREERVYEHYEVQTRPNAYSPARPLSDEDESPPPTPETVRSMKSAKSSDSSTTITRDTPEPTRPAPPPPSLPRALPPTPVTPSVSAKENSSTSDKGDKRNSILLENPTAYQLISRYGQTGTRTGSDTDELSDNALEVSYDGWDTDSSPATTDHVQKGQVNVITIGDVQPQSVPKILSPKIENVIDLSNKVRIHTNSSKTAYSPSDQPSHYKELLSNYTNNFPLINNHSSSSNDNSPRTSSSSRSASSNTKSSSKSADSDSKCSSLNSKSAALNGKYTSANDRIYSSTNKISVSKNRKISNNKNSLSSGKNTALNENMSIGGNSNPTMTGISSGPRLEVKKLHETSELQHGGSTVRIAGQRMLVLTPGCPHTDPQSGFSSGDENEASIEDDTSDHPSDYPMSSPTTTRGSDTDTLLEEDDLPLDFSNPTYNTFSSQHELSSPNFGSSDHLLDSSNMQCERWAPARDTILEEEEIEDEWLIGNNHKGDMLDDDDDESALLGDEDEKDDPSVSSSTSSPLCQEGIHPTLSELLKVKSILKKPPSVDTSSETDSDFYLPTFSEFKQNQRKKKQVQFRSSHDVTVIEDAGESKGRKVTSSKSLRREREKAKEKQKNEYNLVADLQDVYARNNNCEVFKSHMEDEFGDAKCSHEQVLNGECNEETASVDGNHLTQEELGEVGRHEPVEDGESCSNSEQSVVIEHGEERLWSVDQKKNENSCRGDECEGYSLHRSLSDHQTSGVSTTNSHDTLNFGLNSCSKLPIASFNTSSSSVITPTRQAPPPPCRNYTLSPTRPNVPPPPPPISRPLSLCVAPPKISPPQRPLPSPPALPLNPPPESPSPPPPIPTSPPPVLEETHHMAVINHSSEDLSSPQSPTFSSFKANHFTVNPPKTISPSLALPAATSEMSRSTECLREVLPPLGSVPVFGADEETRTATIRGRGAAHARPSIVNAFTAGASANASSSSHPVAPRRRNRNRSLSPEANESMTGSSTRILSGRVRRASFLNGLGRDENPYEQITDHIYEELLSHSPSRTSTFTGHNSPALSSSPHKSPSPGKSMFEGASKYEILEYLQDARRRVANTVDDEDEDVTLQGMEDGSLDAEVDLEDEEEDQLGVDPSEDHFTVLTSRNRGNRSSNMSSNSDSSENSGLLRSDKERLATGEIERTDSGVGSETSKPAVVVGRGQRGAGVASATRDGDVPLCDDCDAPVDTHITNSGVVYAPLVCRRCSRRRQERKEILTEIMETEIKYGRDLRVMVDEFYRPILVAGLLTHDQLRGIFLNVEELVEHNRGFSLQLRDALEIALDQGDEDLLTVNVAKLFLHAAPMLHAFENYCVRQGSASILLQTLEKERELLRIFLKVSQMENTLLRRMNLHSFLMVPVQRVTKYPLLLARLYKATPPTHPSREDCRRAKEKIELHLQHMNNETKEISPTKLWRRISMSVGSGAPLKRSPQPHDFSTNLKLRKLALEVLEWSEEEARVVREGRLFCLAPDSNNWTRRGRSLKMASVHVILITLGSPTSVFEEAVPEDGLVTPRNLGIKDAAILAFKDHKVSKAALIRHDPWLLSRCVVAWESEGETECFELTDLNSKDTYIFKGSDCTSTEAWFRYIQFHALSVGMWKRRRPALANIMISGLNRS